MTIPRTFLITGGAGFIGSHFSGLCVRNGIRTLVLDKLSYAGHEVNLADFAQSSGPGSLTLIQGDICDTELVRRILRENEVQVLVNFAAESHVDRSIQSAYPFIETNIVGTFSLLSAALDHFRSMSHEKSEHFRYVQISTDEVYGSLGPSGFFTEATPYAPNSPYSASKASADHLVRAWHHTHSLPTLITHCSNNYGPRQFPEKLIPFMIHRAITDQSLPVYGDGKNVRDWIHVEDHCRGIWQAIERGIPGSTYCFGGRSERDNFSVVRTLCAHLDELRPRSDRKSHQSAIAFVEDRLGHDRRYAIDDRLAEKELGFVRRHTFESGLRATVEWYLANDHWRETVLESCRTRRESRS